MYMYHVFYIQVVFVTHLQKHYCHLPLERLAVV